MHSKPPSPLTSASQIGSNPVVCAQFVYPKHDTLYATP